MKKLVAWLGAALFIVVVMAIVFRVSMIRNLVTGTTPAA